MLGVFNAIKPVPAIDGVLVLIVSFFPQFVLGVEYEVWAVKQLAAIDLIKTCCLIHPVTVHPLAVAIVGSSVAVPQFPVTVIVLPVPVADSPV